MVLNGSGSDPEGDPLTFTWDLDGDGVFGETGLAADRGDEVGASPTFQPRRQAARRLSLSRSV